MPNILWLDLEHKVTIITRGYGTEKTVQQVLVTPKGPAKLSQLITELNTRLYKKRNVVECCFAKLKEHLRIATRSEKTARNYLSMLKLGAIRLFLKRLSN